MFLSKEAFRLFFRSYGEIFFIKSPLAGLGIFLLTLTNPTVGFSGLIAILSAWGFAQLMGAREKFLSSGLYIYNTLLVGLSVGYLFKLGPLTLFFLVFAAILTFMLTLMLSHVFFQLFNLPVLSVPFVVVSSICYLAAYSYSNLYVNGLYVEEPSANVLLPVWLSGFFRSMGAVLFLPYVGPGVVLSLIVLLKSRVLFFLGAGGYYLGSLATGMMIGSYELAFQQVSHFNYLLIGMAVGGVFLVPCLRSTLMAAVAIGVCTLLNNAVNVFWSTYGIPVFTLPFNVVTLTFVYVLSLVKFPWIPAVFRETPEATLDEFFCRKKRFDLDAIKVNLPFSGRWSVWQGFDGKWTHQGAWKYAYDFVIKRDGQTYENNGSVLEDYFSYKKPVFSPCRGRVVSLVSTIDDNPPKTVDKNNNWGNHVIIDTQLGYWLELSHFAKGSIKVKVGQWVEIGELLGLCGNSGYSPEPHIHIQVQQTDKIAAKTLPFVFQNYKTQEGLMVTGVPEEGEDVEPWVKDKQMKSVFGFPLKKVIRYKVLNKGELVSRFNIHVLLNELGESYFKTNKGKLFYTEDDGAFYFYRLEGHCSWLRLLYRCMPRVPMHYVEGQKWEDHLPIKVVATPWGFEWWSFLKAWLPINYTASFHGRWEEALSFASKVRWRKRLFKAKVYLKPGCGVERVELQGSFTIVSEEDES